MRALHESRGSLIARHPPSRHGLLFELRFIRLFGGMVRHRVDFPRHHSDVPDLPGDPSIPASAPHRSGQSCQRQTLSNWPRYRGACSNSHWHSHSKSAPNIVPSASRQILASMYSNVPSVRLVSDAMFVGMFGINTQWLSGSGTSGCRSFPMKKGCFVLPAAFPRRRSGNCPWPR